jgi:hypothetical protein
MIPEEAIALAEAMMAANPKLTLADAERQANLMLAALQRRGWQISKI